MLPIVLLSCLINGAVSLFGGLALIMAPRSRVERINGLLVPFTAGLLLATALFDILPETLPYAYTKAFVWMFGAIAVSFFLGQLVHLFEARKQHTGLINRSAVFAIAATSAVHNIIYGALIAIFATSPGAGISAALVLALSDIPHEAGVSSLLLHHGLNRRQIVWLQFWVTLPTLLGGLIGYSLHLSIFSAVPLVMAALAGWFIYVVVHDIFGQMEQLSDAISLWRQFISFTLGALLVIWLIYRFGNILFGYHPIYIDHPL